MKLQKLTIGTNLRKLLVEILKSPDIKKETSKYPEEKKSTEIPLVVASERGLALKWLEISGTLWKVRP